MWRDVHKGSCMMGMNGRDGEMKVAICIGFHIRGKDKEVS